MIILGENPKPRDESAESLQIRGYADIMDPEAKLPQHCARCRRKSTERNPLMMSPVTHDPRSLARAYLYRAECYECRLQSRRR